MSVLASGLFLLGCAGSTGLEEDKSLCATQIEIPELECLALVALFEATDIPTWPDSTGWGVSETPCSWEGVLCESGSVTRLNLGSRGLTGTIPPELGDLSALWDLSLPGNNLSGPIPPELANLSNLEVLYLFWNNLTGTIPPEIGSLADLTVLGLHGNGLTGSIPSELGGLSKLQRLFLDSNELTGSIPLSVAQLGGAMQSGISGPVSCRFLPGNAGLFLPDSEGTRAADLDSDGLICGVAFSN